MIRDPIRDPVRDPVWSDSVRSRFCRRRLLYLLPKQSFGLRKHSVDITVQVLGLMPVDLHAQMQILLNLFINLFIISHIISFLLQKLICSSKNA